MAEASRRPDELLLAELTGQLNRPRALLSGNPDTVATQALTKAATADTGPR